jgi:hypothetical protein
LVVTLDSKLQVMKKLPFFFAIAFFCFKNSLAQNTNQQKENEKQQAVQTLVASKHYRFVPQTAFPSRGSTKIFNGDFELIVATDTLTAYLPYFGRAYTASIGSTDGPLDFRTTEFKYTITEGKKGGWEVTMTPKNAGDARQLSLSITKDGYASLQVMSNNHDPISFNGYIQ